MSTESFKPIETPPITASAIVARVDEIIGDVNTLEFNEEGVAYHGPVRIIRTSGLQNKYYTNEPDQIAYRAELNGFDVAYRTYIQSSINGFQKHLFSRLEGSNGSQLGTIIASTISYYGGEHESTEVNVLNRGRTMLIVDDQILYNSLADSGSTAQEIGKILGLK